MVISYYPSYSIVSLCVPRPKAYRVCGGASVVQVSIQYNTIQYNTIQYNTIQYNTIQYNTIQYNTIQYNTIQYNTIQYNTIQYNTIHCYIPNIVQSMMINCCEIICENILNCAAKTYIYEIRKLIDLKMGFESEL